MTSAPDSTALASRLPAWRPWLELPEEELVAVAREELNEPVDDDLARVAAGEAVLQALRDAQVPLTSGWLSYAPEGYAVAYLRWAKWSVPKAVQRMRATNQWLAQAGQGDGLDLRFEDVRAVFDCGLIRLTGRPGRCGGLVQVVRPAKALQGRLPDPSALLRWHVWSLRRAVHNKAAQVRGVVLVEDFQGMTSLSDGLRFMALMKPITGLQMTFVSECAPVRVRQISILRQPSFFTMLWAVARPFLSKKMRERVQLFSDDLARLHAEVADPFVLPYELGGSCCDFGEAWCSCTLAAEASEDAASAKGAAGVALAAKGMLDIAPPVGVPARVA